MALALALAVSADQDLERITAAKRQLNQELSAVWNVEPTHHGQASLDEWAQHLTRLANKALQEHTTATTQLPTLHAQLAAALTRSPTDFALPIATQLDHLVITHTNKPESESEEHDQDQDLAIAQQLEFLTTTRARIDSARIALADVRRWASLPSTVLDPNPDSDPSDAAQAFAAAHDDLARLASYLPPQEHARRVKVLDELRTQLWARLAPKLDAALCADPSTSSPASSSSRPSSPTNSAAAAAGDVAALYALAQRIGATPAFVTHYCRVRTQSIVSRASNPAAPSNVLTVLADVVEHDLATFPLLPSDRLPLSLALLHHALTQVPLPDDPTGDPAIVSRLARLYPGDKDQDAFSHAIEPLLARMHALPHRACRLALAAIDTLFDRIPLSAPAATASSPAANAHQIDQVWRTHVMPSALAVPVKVMAQHTQVCGGLRIQGLAHTLQQTWEHMCTRLGQVLDRLHTLHGQARAAADAARSKSGSKPSDTLTLDPEAMARYVASVQVAVAVLEKAQAVESQLAAVAQRGAEGVPPVVAAYLTRKDKDVQPTPLQLVGLTHDLGAKALNYAFEYVLAPVTRTLAQGVLPSLLAPSRRAVPAPPVRPSTPLSRSGTPQPAAAPRATMVTTLPQFSRSPTPAATALGEYLLQLPHHLHALAALGSGVPGAHAFAFAASPQTALGKLVALAAPDPEPVDLLEAVVLASQLTVLQSLAVPMADPPTPLTPVSVPVPSGGGGVAHSASTGRLASLVSSTLSGLPASLSMRAGLTDLATSPGGGGATSPRAVRSSTPHPPPTPDAPNAPMALAPGTRDQLAQDLAYLGNVFTALDCPPRAEWMYLVALVETGGPRGGWDASRVAGVLGDESAGDAARRVGRLADWVKEVRVEGVVSWWGKVARGTAGVFPPTAGAGGLAKE